MKSIQARAAGAIGASKQRTNTTRQEAAAAISARFDARRAAVTAKYSAQLEVMSTAGSLFRELQEAFA